MTYSQEKNQSTETNMEMLDGETHGEDDGDDGIHREGSVKS